MTALHLQEGDSSEFTAVIQEMKIFFDDHALSAFHCALYGEINRVRYKATHLMNINERISPDKPEI